MTIQFPSNPNNGQLYPDTANGDTALVNGRVYKYNSSQGLWLIKEPEKRFVWKYVNDVPRPGEFRYAGNVAKFEISFQNYWGDTIFDSTARNWTIDTLIASNTGDFTMSCWHYYTNQMRCCNTVKQVKMHRFYSSSIGEYFEGLQIEANYRPLDILDHMTYGNLYEIVIPGLLNP